MVEVLSTKRKHYLSQVCVQKEVEKVFCYIIIASNCSFLSAPLFYYYYRKTRNETKKMLGRRVEVVVTEFATGFFFLFRQTIYLLHPSLALHPFSLSLFRSGFSRSIYNIIIIMAIYVVVVVILKHHHITYNIELTFNQLTVHFTTWARKKVKHFFLLLSFPPLLLSSLFILALCLSACLVFFSIPPLTLFSLSVCIILLQDEIPLSIKSQFS